MAYVADGPEGADGADGTDRADKHFQRHSRPKALSNLTQSTHLGLSRSFNKL